MVAGFEASKEASLGEPLEVIFTNILKIFRVISLIFLFLESGIYQHCCTKVKLVKELGDEDVHFQHIGNVLLLHFSENVDEPFKLSMGLGDPEEVNFLASNPGVSETNNYYQTS